MTKIMILNRATVLYKSTQGISMHKKFSFVVAKAQALVKPRYSRLLRRIKTGHISLAFKVFGPSFAIRAFWKTPLATHTWHDVEMRLKWLDRNAPSYIAEFVTLSATHTKDSTTLLGLAQSSLSDTHLRPLMALVDGAPPKYIQERIIGSQTFAAAYLGTQILLEDAETARIANRYIIGLLKGSRKSYELYLDSISFCPHAIGKKQQFKSGFTAPKNHRLLILENAKTPRDFSYLMRDAKHVTVIDMNDLYGKTCFTEIKERGVKTINVEHVRTRITRFSTDYHQLHEDTKNAATHIMHYLDNCLDQTTDLFGNARGSLTLDLADKIFFESLKVRALSKLIADENFDHIVVANQSDASHAFYGVLSCVDALRNDPRVEFVSTARNMTQRLRAHTTIRAATTPPKPVKMELEPESSSFIQRDLTRKARTLASKMSRLPDSKKDRVAVITCHNPAYNSSTAASMLALSKTHQVSGIFPRGSVGAFFADDATKTTLQHITPITISSNMLPNLSELSRWLQYHTQDAAQSISDLDVRAVVTAFTGQIVRNSLLPDVANFASQSAWLSKLKAEGQLPKLAIVTPIRDARNNVFCDAFRDFDTPSLALEPHGLNGNYCRYSKISTDYYGVISQYFRGTAQSDFGIPENRCHIIGSPRIIAKKDYDPASAQIEARKDLEGIGALTFDRNQSYVSFFCQPTQWEHMAKVWSNILRATRDLNVTVLLKTHPEESISRTQRYMALAEQFGSADRVVHVETHPDTVIKASDLVLTGYSAAALDAATLQKPVLCVTADNASYPVDQHTIVHTKLCGTVDGLRSELESLLNDPNERSKQASAFLKAEPQFVSGPDDLLRDLVTKLIKTPPTEALRAPNTLPKNLFLDAPFTPFSV
jgi:hypothetical protein